MTSKKAYLTKLVKQISYYLSNKDAKEFQQKIMTAINSGKDLNNVWPRLAYWLLVDEHEGIIKFVKNEKQSEAIKNVAELFKRQINNELISSEKWGKAGDYAAEAAKEGYDISYACGAVADENPDLSNARAYAADCFNSAGGAADAAYVANAMAMDIDVDVLSVCGWRGQVEQIKKLAEKLIEIVNNET